MWNRIWRKLVTTVTGGAIIIATASIVSRLLGLVRDRLLAATFGAGDQLDMYYAAFKIPDFIVNILVLGALSSAFLPVFIQYREQNGKEAWHIANSLLNILLLGVLVLGGIFFLFTPQLAGVIAPGFSPDKQLITAHLTRIMLLSVLFFTISNIFTGLLNSYKRYVNFAFAPVLYNLGIIAGIMLLAPKYGIYGVAYGVVLGSILHVLIQLPAVRRLGFRYKIILDSTHAGVRKIGRLMVPRAFGLGVGQIEQMVSIIIGSTLAVGSVAVFNLANNLGSFPISVVGVSLAIASFPIFSEAFAQKNTEKFVVQFSVSFRRILFLIIPLSVVILLLRAQIVRVILGTGNFDWEDTFLTAQTLGFFSVSLFAQSVIPLLARSFYAFHDTKTPVLIASVSVVANLTGALILTRVMSDPVTGLALSFSIASILQMLLLLGFLRKRVGYMDDTKIIKSVLKISLASLAMGGVIWVAKYVIAQGVNMQTFVGIFLQGAVAAVVGITAYLVFAMLLRCDEIKIITDWLVRVRRQIINGNHADGK